MDSRENSMDSTGNGMSVPYQESGSPADVFRGREEMLASLAPTVSVFTGTAAESEFPPAATRPQKTYSVVPPTEAGGGGGGSRDDGLEDGTDSQTAVQMLCERVARLETDQTKMQTDHTRMQSEIDQLKNSVTIKDREIQEKDKEISRLKEELEESDSQRAALEKKLADERAAHAQELQEQCKQHKEKEKQLNHKIANLERQKSVIEEQKTKIEEERSMLIRKMSSDDSVKRSVRNIEDRLDLLSESDRHETHRRSADEHDSGALKFTFSSCT